MPDCEERIATVERVVDTEMRPVRELKAQEKANRLPVKMSAVLATMKPTLLLMITLTPVLIRWMRVMTVE
jgi:tight adherence protein C